MRYFTLVFCLLSPSLQAHACMVSEGVTLFFEAIPNPQPDADVIATISVSDVNGTLTTGSATATVTVMQIIKTSDARVHQGDEITMKYGFDSCGPGAYKGAKGTIVARTGTDSEGRPVLYPYSKDGKGRIAPPFARTRIAQTPSPKSEELAKLNSSCAAFYDTIKSRNTPWPKVKQEFIDKFNIHKLYAQRLYEPTVSAENRYEIDFSREKLEFEKAQSEKNLAFQRWIDKCVSVEFHTPLVIKESKLRLNR